VSLQVFTLACKHGLRYYELLYIACAHELDARSVTEEGAKEKNSYG